MAISRDLDKFISYLLCSHIIVFTDHATLRYLLKKHDVKPRLTRWMLLLQEFDIEIRDRNGVKNLIANHLNKIKGPVGSFPIRGNFPDVHLMQLYSSHVTPWFADIMNFIVSFVVPPHASRS